MARRIIRHTYRTVRSVIFTALLAIIAIYLALYGLVSLPWFQNKVAGIAEKELSTLLGGDLKIGKLTIYPFSEVRLADVSLSAPGEKPCIRVASVGAAIDIRRLIFERVFDLSYVEITGLDGRIAQAQKDGPLNIKFLIEALRPKDKNKPPTEFKLIVRRATIRDSRVSFQRLWSKAPDVEKLDFNRLIMSSLNADLRFPFVSEKSVKAEVSRLQFTLQPGLHVENLSFKADYDSSSLTLSDFLLRTPGSRISLSDLSLRMTDSRNPVKSFETGSHRLSVKDGVITPSDFSPLLPELRSLSTPWNLNIELSGNLRDVRLERLALQNEETDTRLAVVAEVSEPFDKEKISFTVDNLTAAADSRFILSLPWLGEKLSRSPGLGKKGSHSGQGHKIREIITNAGRIELAVKGNGFPAEKLYRGEGRVETSCGTIDFDGSYGTGPHAGKGSHIVAKVGTDGFDVGRLLAEEKIGKVSLDAEGRVELVKGLPVGNLKADIPGIEMMGSRLDNLHLEASNDGNKFDLQFISDDNDLQTALTAAMERKGDSPQLELNLNVDRFVPSVFGLMPKYEGYEFSTHLVARAEGLEPERMTGYLMMYHTAFTHPSGKGGIDLDMLKLTSTEPEPGKRQIDLQSDWADLSLMVKGLKEKARGSGALEKLTGMTSPASAVDYKGLIESFKYLLSQTLPLYSGNEGKTAMPTGEELEADLSLTLKAPAETYEFFNLPLFPLGEGKLTAFFSSVSGEAEVNADFPYIQQGPDKLIERTRLDAVLSRADGTVGVNAFTHYPAKKGDMDIEVQVLARQGSVFCDLGFNRDDPQALLHGTLGLNAHLDRNPLTRMLRASVTLLPSQLDLKGRPWQIDRGVLTWTGEKGTVEHLHIHSGKQFLSIDGTASQSEDDVLTVNLAGIDIGAIFEVLNINYVTFGGMATGQATGRALLSKAPVLTTNGFSVSSLSYNGAVLGDAELKSSFDTAAKKVAIRADIDGKEGRKATIDGGIWVGRDSLSFDIDAGRIDIGFMAPFVSAFATDLRGEASGKAKLFGTFSDIDLTGRLFADTIGLRLLSTNVVYAGSDSVIMERGRIRIPSFRLYDRDGHSALLSGELSHRYFHDPEFEFRLTEAENLLCYDIGANDNPDWYGTIYGTGTGMLTGRPGIVSVDVDMTTNQGSTFTFVLSDRESAEDYGFITFTDKRKKQRMAAVVDTTPPFLKRFLKKGNQEEAGETDVLLDFRATVTPLATVTLVMDPTGGDKITCHGGGPLQMTYSSASNDLRMYGKYTLDDGIYNFTLQDIILKDFVIKPGSSIAFNGDPLAADLDISATYRVNTSLTDLDQSFVNDRELNRTNVPVEAVLNVAGRMTSPDITFDIELPTLTSDVERKVKSLISTEDMMSRQIIYLLALNRFYTPEYTGATSSTGSELSSVASSTLSSQLSNMLSRMTDLINVAPSIRSEKGDFSDMEVDLALSSRLLDNRLLINGNFGYRDRGLSTQSTQFIGDFDVEYLLNKSGNLRLKAYNRFNDQNYYLRQAMTTQGIGLVVRRDFDHIFSFLRPLKRLFKGKEEDDGARETDESGNGTNGVAERIPENNKRREEKADTVVTVVGNREVSADGDSIR